MFDFEYAQPLYDLAFLLEIDARYRNIKVPKYRVLALWKAALSLDGYESRIDQWLSGELTLDDLDQSPSVRIRQHLEAIRNTGTLPELQALRATGNYERALRLRSIRGLGPVQIVEALACDLPTDEWFRRSVSSTGLTKESILNVLLGSNSDRRWQSSHVLGPLLRVLNCFEAKHPGQTLWHLPDTLDALSSVQDCLKVCYSTEATAAFRRRFNSVVKRDNMYVAAGGSNECYTHRLGWSFRLAECQHGGHLTSMSDLNARWQRSVSVSSGRICSDLHMHSTWSDGAASIQAMAAAAKEIGHDFIAITDHSRSCKLQRGLTPVEWFRQSISLQSLHTAVPVIHGIEVDILHDGSLDLPQSLLKHAGIVIGSVHTNWARSKSQNTDRLITAIESGCIDVIGHPTSALIGKPGVPDFARQRADVDWPIVFETCAKWHVALEFNCFPSRFDLPVDMLKSALEVGCWISIGSDAHARSHLSNIYFGYEAITRITSDRVLNLLSLDEYRAWKANAVAERSRLCRHRDTSQGTFWERKPHVQEIYARLSDPPQLPAGSSVVGIDLTAGDKATGVAFLEGNRVETCSLITDDELIEYIVNKHPAIVSIDSPLGLPGGGADIDKSAGIVRVAEHELSSVGIPSYPALIDSMRQLTLRGIRLRQRIEQLECRPVVIESYPGAAQDILSFPRKQRGLNLLRGGLASLGLTGSGLNSQSHDEIDAITSALVGRFYEAGNFEPMGLPSEAQLIVPKHCLFRFDNPPIICLAGQSGVGKSVVARYLATIYGFDWIRTRDLIRDLLIEDCSKSPSRRLFKRKIDPSNILESDLRDFGYQIKCDLSQKPLVEILNKKLSTFSGPVVVDAVRTPNDVDAHLFQRPVYTLFVSAKGALVAKRIKERSKKDPNKPASRVKLDAEIHASDFESAIVIDNSGSLEELRWRIDDAMLSFIRLVIA